MSAKNIVNAASIRGIALRSSAWWDSLSAEQQQGYIEEHPNSSYAQDAKKAKESKEGHKDTPASKPKDDKTKAPTKDDKPAADAPKHAKIKHAVKQFVKTVEANPGSETRRTFGQMILGKAKGVVKGLMHEGAHIVAAGTSVMKLARGQALSHKEKHHMKEVATRLIVILGAAAVTGGVGAIFAHGIAGAASHLAEDFVAHGLIGVSEETIMHAAKDEGGKEGEEGLNKMTRLLAAYLQDSPNVKDILEKYSSSDASEEDAE